MVSSLSVFNLYIEVKVLIGVVVDTCIVYVHVWFFLNRRSILETRGLRSEG